MDRREERRDTIQQENTKPAGYIIRLRTETRTLSNRWRMNRLALVFARSPLLPSSKFSRFALAVACLLTGVLILLVVCAPRNGQVAADLLQSTVAVAAGICAI